MNKNKLLPNKDAMKWENIGFIKKILKIVFLMFAKKYLWNGKLIFINRN